MAKELKQNIAEPGHRSCANGQPVAEVSSRNTDETSLRPVSESVPTTQNAVAAVPKPKVDRAQFVSKTTPATAPSGAQQTKFPLRKPGEKLFFRATDDRDACMTADIIEGNMSKAYVVGVNVTRDAGLDRLITQALLVPCVNERGQAFVWFIKTSSREWYASAVEMAEEARHRWTRIEADSYAQAYRVEYATAYPELERSKPNWPMSASDILDEVLTSSAITTDDDPVLLDILGKRRSRRTA